MLEVQAIFGAEDNLTPEFAAKVVDLASRYEATMLIDYHGKHLQTDSLISVLAMNLYRGVPVGILAEGADAQEAADALKRLLEG